MEEVSQYLLYETVFNSFCNQSKILKKVSAKNKTLLDITEENINNSESLPSQTYILVHDTHDEQNS